MYSRFARFVSCSTGEVLNPCLAPRRVGGVDATSVLMSAPDDDDAPAALP